MHLVKKGCPRPQGSITPLGIVLRGPWPRYKICTKSSGLHRLLIQNDILIFWGIICYTAGHSKRLQKKYSQKEKVSSNTNLVFLYFPWYHFIVNGINTPALIYSKADLRSPIHCVSYPIIVDENRVKAF